MASKKDITSWLKKEGLKESDVDAMWEELVKINFKCKIFDDKYPERHWRGMNMHLIEQIPTLKEEQLKAEAEKLVREEEERKRKEKEEAARKYYNEHFLELMVKKIDSDEPLTEREISRLVYEHCDDSLTEYGDNMRWERPVSSYFSYDDRMFEVAWCEGLTECQENSFYDQPYEVEQHIEEKVIEVVTYTRKKKSKRSAKKDAVEALGETLIQHRDAKKG